MEQRLWCMKAKALCSLHILLISSWSSRLNCTRVCFLSPLLNCNYKSLVDLAECNVMFVFKHMTNYSLLGEKLTAEVFWTWTFIWNPFVSLPNQSLTCTRRSWINIWWERGVRKGCSHYSWQTDPGFKVGTNLDFFSFFFLIKNSKYILKVIIAIKSVFGLWLNSSIQCLDRICSW